MWQHGTTCITEWNRRQSQCENAFVVQCTTKRFPHWQWKQNENAYRCRRDISLVSNLPIGTSFGSWNISQSLPVKGATTNAFFVPIYRHPIISIGSRPSCSYSIK